MKTLKLTTLSIALGLAFSAGVIAQGVTKDANKVVGIEIAKAYAADKNKCDALSANAKDICIAEAKGKANVANAALEASYEPSAKHNYKLLAAKAEADFAVANQKCDDQTGNARDVCVKEAKAIETRIKADGEAQWKIGEANQTAIDKSAAADATAKEQGAAARQEASMEKRDANYALAKEKCDALTTPEADRCVKDAKLKYGM